MPVWAVPLAICGTIAAFYWQILTGVYWIWEDGISFYYPNLAHAVQQLRQGVFPWWNPFEFAGNVFAADIQTLLFYPFHWLLLLVQLPFGPSYFLQEWYIVLHLMWMGLGQFRVLRDFGFGRKSAIPAALGLVLSGYITAHVIHLTLILTAAWMPWAFLYFRRTLNTKQLRPACLAALCLGFAMLGGLPQISVHFYYFLGAFALFHVWSEKEFRTRTVFRTAGLAALIFTLAFGLASVIYLQTMEAAPYTERHALTYAEAESDAVRPARLLTFLAPRLFGVLSGNDPSVTSFWGESSWLYWEGQMYIGVLALIFAALGFAVWRSRMRVFLGAVIAFALVASMAKTFPLFKLLFHAAPGLGTFRVPPRFLYYVAFCSSIVAAAGLDWFWKSELGTRSKITRTLLIVAGGLALVWLGFAAGLFQSFSPAFANDSVYRNATNEWLWQAALVLGAAGLVALSSRMAPSALCALLVVLLAGDLYRAHGTFPQGQQSTSDFFTQIPLLDLFRDKAKGELFRSSTRIGNQLLLQKRQGMVDQMFSMQGYNPLRPRATAEMERNLPRESVLDLYNVKYSLESDPSTGMLSMRERNTYKPRFWFADSCEVVADSQAVFQRMKDPAFPHRSLALLTESIPDFQPLLPEPAKDGIRIDRYSATRIELTISCGGPRLLIASENYFPAWKARLDGKPQKIYTADRAFWAVPIPAGEHGIVFSFSSRMARVGGAISAASLAVIVAGLWISRRRRTYTISA